MASFFFALGKLCHKVSEGVAHQTDDQSAGERKAEGSRKGLQVYRLQDLLVIIQSKFPIHTVAAVCCGKAQCNYIQKRQCDEDQCKKIQRQDHPYGACSVLTHGYLLHRDLTDPAILLLIFLPDLPALHL